MGEANRLAVCKLPKVDCTCPIKLHITMGGNLQGVKGQWLFQVVSKESVWEGSGK